MTIPFIKVQKRKKVLMVDDKPFIMLAGEIHNSSSSSPEYMIPIWDKAKELNLNSLLIPVSWELIEPEEDNFDFSIVDQLILQAREYNMKIGFLWFGSWKNGQCYYAPRWVKKDTERFHRAQIKKGDNGIILERMHNMSYSTLSAFCENNVKADCKAFSNLMRHINEFDRKENTVIVVQVENEPGLLGGGRELSNEADKYFNELVDIGLINYLKENYNALSIDLKNNFNINANNNANWKEVFGGIAEEVFTSYYVAKYINEVAKAGKEEYALPMVVNCWLDKGQEPGKYPTGGPVSKMMDIYHYAAPYIDIICPDIYVPYFYEVCDQYVIKDNPLFIAECATHSYALSREIYTIGHYNTICYSPFGIEDLGKQFSAMEGVLFGIDVNDEALNTPQDPIIYSKANQLINELMFLIGERYGSNKIQSATFEIGQNKVLFFDNYAFDIHFESKFLVGKFGSCLILEKNKDEFYIIANNCQINSMPHNTNYKYIEYLSVEDGHFMNNEWIKGRRLNGDEITTMCFNEPILLKIELKSYN